MVFSLWLWPTTESTVKKNTNQTVAILITVWMWRCNAGRIAQWSTSCALLEATGCRHWLSACATLPRRPPWSTNLLKTQTLAKKLFSASQLMVDRSQKLWEVLPQSRPSTQLINATSCIKTWDITIGAEELSYISSYQTLSADHNWKSYKPSTKLI